MESSIELPPPPPEELRRPVASIWTRGGELVLEGILLVCTFGFGWVGWWIIAWADGQSPAKVVLHLHVVNASDGRLTSFGRMAVREAAGKAIAGVVGAAGLYLGHVWMVGVAALYFLVGAGVALFDNRRRTLWDRLAGTVVLEGDPPPLVPPVVGAALEDEPFGPPMFPPVAPAAPPTFPLTAPEAEGSERS